VQGVLAVFGPQGLALLPYAVSRRGHWEIVRIRVFWQKRKRQDKLMVDTGAILSGGA
jgi:hypothetical protein